MNYAHISNKIRILRSGYNPSFALFVYLFGYAFFLNDMYVRGLLFFLLIMRNILTLKILMLILTEVVAKDVGEKSNTLVAKKLLKRGWVFAEPDYPLVMKTKKKWGIG